MSVLLSRRTPLSLLLLLILHVGGVPAADLPEIRRQGVLRVAMRWESTLIFSPGNSEFPGFCYELAREFSRHLGVETGLHRVDSFGAYWQRVEGQDGLSLFNEVDLYADILTVTPGRQELLFMTPFVENTEILVGRAGSRTTELGDLTGKRVAVVEGMSFQQILEDALFRAGVAYRRVPAVLENGKIVPDVSRDDDGDGDGLQSDTEEFVQLLILPRGTGTPLMFFPEQLELGAVDFFVVDSFSLFHQLYVSQALRSMVRPLFPINEGVGELAFGSSRSSPRLNRAIADWMDSFRTTAEYEALVHRYIGIPYERYRGFIEDFPE